MHFVAGTPGRQLNQLPRGRAQLVAGILKPFRHALGGAAADWP